ncbi:hypothetical protein HanLR1_Chr03g0079281 [Helianthus annuus]|nr:hypothetical protein HanLR1_Chr03g0079281 [Helianthus annuus]
MRLNKKPIPGISCHNKPRVSLAVVVGNTRRSLYRSPNPPLLVHRRRTPLTAAEP